MVSNWQRYRQIKLDKESASLVAKTRTNIKMINLDNELTINLKIKILNYMQINQRGT